MAHRLPAIVLVVLAIAASAQATTITIAVGGGGDYDNFFSAVLNATEGDTILVAPGTYTGAENRNIDPGGTNLVFIAESERAPVVIDCQGAERAFHFWHGETSATLVRGFTITNGMYAANGGAVACQVTSPTCEDCVFVGNDCALGGGAMYFNQSSSVVRNCVFDSNMTVMDGAGICAYYSSLSIEDCLFIDNATDFQDGGGVYANGGTDVITGCTFSGNSRHTIMGYNVVSLTVTRCVLAFTTDGGPLTTLYGAVPTTTHCVVFANSSTDSLPGNHTDNLFVDPHFCGMHVDNYEYCANSLCLPENNVWMELIGVGPGGCIPCVAPVEQSTWGAIKGFYR
jgi:hypothetical protein